MRIEKDFIGELEIEEDCPFGINTLRAAENFNFSKQFLRYDIFKAMIEIKKAAAMANHSAGLLESEKSISELILEKKILSKKKLEKLLTPQVMASPGLPVLEDDHEE